MPDPAYTHPRSIARADAPLAAPETEGGAVDPEPPERLSVTVVAEDGDWAGVENLEAKLGRAADALARHLRLPGAGHASIVLGSDVMVQGLNRAYRGKDAPTNVLSFPYQARPGADAQDDGYLGDIVLAAETVAREATERGIPIAQHAQHLAVHGLLHLLHYDHQTDAEAEAMEQVERNVLAALGIADPYAADPNETDD